MVIPKLGRDGTFPVGVHSANLKEVRRVFGTGSPRRLEINDPHALWIEQKADEHPPRLIDVIVAANRGHLDSWGRFYMQDPWYGDKGILEVRT